MYVILTLLGCKNQRGEKEIVMSQTLKEHDEHEKVSVFFIDQQQFKLERDEMKVRELLILASEDPTQTTLALLHGNRQDKLTDLDQTIELKNGMKFAIFHNTPTTVS